ncbi:MAG: T9SS type A sorting domain-containing protein, partial [Gemmatimonadetes bacterium]|nr:T9SS type A sorting domain-containing protein [Gemmatimonadota bacterium]
LGFGDYDLDGDLDIAIATLQADQPNRLFRNDCPLANNWLQVVLEGVQSNRSAVGARLRAVDGKFVQHRHVESSFGLFSQNSAAVQFGFGLASRRASSVIDSLIITWPSGTVQTITGIAVNQRLHVLEDSTTTALLVSGFQAEPRAGAVDLQWWASTDHATDGFLVFRAPTSEGPWRRLNDRPLPVVNPVRFTDREVEPLATYYYRLEDASGAEGPLTAPLLVRTGFWSARHVALEPARPNPFRGGTELAFSLLAPGNARLTVYDVSGRRVATVADGRYAAGRQSVVWHGRDEHGRRLPAGVYLYRLEAAGQSEARRVVRLGP